MVATQRRFRMLSLLRLNSGQSSNLRDFDLFQAEQLAADYLDYQRPVRQPLD